MQNRPISLLTGLLASALLVPGIRAHAQIPKINTLFPIGGRAGTTVEVEVRGASLDGASSVMVNGPGVSGSVDGGGTKVDEKFKTLWQNKCQGCHELRSPANRSLTPQQWESTVDRMIRVRQAPITATEQKGITDYLVSAARAGRVTAKLAIAPNTLPGLYEVRLLTNRGISTVGLFEVGNLPEVVGMNGALTSAQPIQLPCIANGSLAANSERHYYKFSAKAGERIVFNLKGARYNEASQFYFNPNLRLYDAQGTQLVSNHGYYDLDPLIDWKCPKDGDYVIEVRDLVGRGNPASVYRLTMGTLPYDTVLYPPGGQAGSKTNLRVVGANTDQHKTDFETSLPSRPALTSIGSPFGPHPFVVSPYPVTLAGQRKVTVAPAGMAGRLTKAGQEDVFTVTGSGAFEFEAFSARVGSRANVRMTLQLDGKGLGTVTGDTRLTATLENGKTYSLVVSDYKNEFAEDNVYFVEARPIRPGLEFVARPDNIALRPGTSVAVEVVLTRRDGIAGDVTISAENLPPGVTATPTVIPPDRGGGSGQAYLILKAAPDAQPSERPYDIVATGKGPLGETRTFARPQQEYRLNNTPYYYNRSQTVVTVRGNAEFSGELPDEPLRVHPHKAVPLKVKILRKEGFKGTVNVKISGLPSGWTASQESGTGEFITLSIRPDGNNRDPFLRRSKDLSPIVAIIEANTDEFEYVVGKVVVVPVDKALELEEKERERERRP